MIKKKKKKIRSSVSIHNYYHLDKAERKTEEDWIEDSASDNFAGRLFEVEFDIGQFAGVILEQASCNVNCVYVQANNGVEHMSSDFEYERVYRERISSNLRPLLDSLFTCDWSSFFACMKLCTVSNTEITLAFDISASACFLLNTF